MVAQQHGRRLDVVFLGDLHHGLQPHERAVRAAKRAVRHDVDALLAAEVDNLLLRQHRVVLDLVDRGDDGGVREQLLEVAFAVLGGGSVTRSKISTGQERRRAQTLDTPMALALPVATSFSICFHVSMWLHEWMMSRWPLFSLGNLSSLPGKTVRPRQRHNPSRSQPQPPSGTYPEGSSTAASAIIPLCQRITSPSPVPQTPPPRLLTTRYKST